MKIWEQLGKIDRRILYLIIGGVVLFPLIVKIILPIHTSPPVEKLFWVIDSIPPPSKALMISVDYDPQTTPELHPMTKAILRHAFVRGVRVCALAFWIQSIGLAEDALTEVAREFNEKAETREDSIIYGRNYVFLGWTYPPLVWLLGMGESIVGVFPFDYYHNKTDTLEIMKYIKSYDDAAILVSFSASTTPISYVAYPQNRFGLRVGAGVTAVSVADFYPYLQSGQLSGLLPGMKGAAEYEELVARHYKIERYRPATQAMSSQTFAHFVIIFFIIIGNISYFVLRRRR